MKKERRQEVVKKMNPKNMNETEKKAAQIFGTLILKKSIIPIVLIFLTLFASGQITDNWWIRFLLGGLVALGGFFYLRSYRNKIQQLKYYEGKVIHIQKKDKSYELLLKNGKMPIKLFIKKGIDEKKVKKNQFIRLYFNEPEKVAIILN